MGATPFDAFAGPDLAYALDDGVPFPDWTPPLLTDAEAQAGYEAGERMAVIAGDPANPTAGLVLDRNNARLAIRSAEPALQFVYLGEPLALAEALWCDQQGRQHWARRTGETVLRISRRPRGAVVWVEEFLAQAPAGDDPTVTWPVFGDWSALAASEAPWVGEGMLELVDADGWMLDALVGASVPSTWRALGKRFDAPRAFGLPPEVLETLAEPLGWAAAGRRWRKSSEVDAPNGPGVTVVTDAVFSAGAGASGEIVTTVTSGAVRVVLDLPSATARSEMRSGTPPGSPSHPRPSTGAQVAVTAILEAGGAAHEAIVAAVRDVGVPAGWAATFG